MLRSLAAAPAAFVVFISAALADPCMLPLAAIEARIRALVPTEALEIERHNGVEVAAVLARLNATPPKTEFEADTVVIAYWRGRPGAVVLLGLDGCLSGQVALPVAHARSLFGEAL